MSIRTKELDYILENKETIGKRLNIPQEFFDMLIEDSKNTEIMLYGNVINTIENEVAICYDADGDILLKIGELDNILGYFETARIAYLSLKTDLGNEMARNLRVITIPKNKELANKMLDTTGYLGLYLKRIKDIMQDLAI